MLGRDPLVIVWVVGSRKVLTDVTSGILQKASIFALGGDFILEAQAVQFGRLFFGRFPGSGSQRESLCVSCKSSSFLPR